MYKSIDITININIDINNKWLSYGHPPKSLTHFPALTVRARKLKHWKIVSPSHYSQAILKSHDWFRSYGNESVGKISILQKGEVGTWRVRHIMAV